MNETETIGQISPQDFVSLGLQQLAYVKPVMVAGTPAFAVHAADGTQIAVMADRRIAVAAITQHDLEAVSVH